MMRKNGFKALFIVLVICCFVVSLGAVLGFSQPDQFTIEAQSGVSPAMIADTELAIRTTTEFCTQEFGFSLPQPVAVLIVRDRGEYQAAIQQEFGLDELAAARWARTTDAVSGVYKMIRNASAANDDSDRIFLTSHEMVHHFQRSIGYPLDGVWVVEGMADAVAAHMTEKIGRRSVAQYEAQWRALLIHQTSLPDLATLSSRQGWADALQLYGGRVTYRTAGLTVLQLWNDYGFSKVLEFYRKSVKEGTAAAFQEVYGLPLDEFQLRIHPVAKQAG